MHRSGVARAVLGGLAGGLACLLAACGGSGGDETTAHIPAAALAAGLAWVDVIDASGEVVMQHRFSAGTSDTEETVTTTQGAGLDGEWGTTDDWRTAVMSCRYTPGESLDQRLLLQESHFSPEFFFRVSSSACWWRRPVAGMLDVNLSGGYVQGLEGIVAQAEITSRSSYGRALMTFLGVNFDESMRNGNVLPLLHFGGGETPSPISFQEGIYYGGIRNCGLNLECEEIEHYESIPPAVSCSVNCTGLNEIIYNPYAGLEVTPDLGSPPTGVKIFNGVQIYPVFHQGKLFRAISSPALYAPLSYPTSYVEYAYDRLGGLTAVQQFSGPGTDKRWFTADDTLTARAIQFEQGNGWNRTYYKATGPDGIWKTEDDIVDRAVRLTKDDEGRIEAVQVCRSAGDDGVWLTPDDVCEVLRFHYQEA